MARGAVKALPYSDWPAVDQRLWEAACADGGLFEERGALAHCADATIYSLRQGYGLWLRWCQQLSQAGSQAPEAALLEQSPQDRVTPHTVEAYLTDLQARVSSLTEHAYIGQLLRVITAMDRDTHWGWLQEVVNRLGRQAKPARDKQSSIQDSAALLELGFELMNSAPEPAAGHGRQAQLTTAMQYRDGLMIALLAARPLRRGNFATIELERSLVKVGHDWWLCFGENETKQHRPIEFMLPTILVEPLERYLAIYRPCFLGASEHRFLWVSRKGGALTDEGFYQSVTKRTRAAFGTAVNPHLFRDCAATTLARHTPMQVRAASQVLGHAHLHTTERHYNQAGAVSAAQDYQATLRALRAGYDTGALADDH